MKRRWMHLIAGLTMCVLCISIYTTTVNADLVWEDNFDDLDDWTIFGYENDTSPVEIGGNFSAASGMLEVLDDDFNVARHESTTNVGTWSFDMFVPDDVPDDGFFYVDFMSNGSYSTEFGNVSVLCVGAAFGASYDKFYFMEGLGSSWHVLRSYRPDVLQGWHHIDVSRNSTGGFLVSFNGTLEWDFIFGIINSSTYLSVVSQNIPGAAIDNLVVDDDPNKTITQTTTNGNGGPIPIWVYLVVGGAVVVLVLVVLFKRR